MAMIGTGQPRFAAQREIGSKIPDMSIALELEMKKPTVMQSCPAGQILVIECHYMCNFAGL